MLSTSKIADTVTNKRLDWIVGDALSYIPIHNHLNQAYHTADMYDAAPPYHLMWQIPANLTPKEVHDAIDAETVITDVKAAITKAQAAITNMRSSIDQQIERVVSHSPDLPYSHLHECVEVVHQVKPGYAPVWSYTYNPYVLANVTLNRYNGFIDGVARPELAPFTRSPIYIRRRRD